MSHPEFSRKVLPALILSLMLYHQCITVICISDDMPVARCVDDAGKFTMEGFYGFNLRLLISEFSSRAPKIKFYRYNVGASGDRKVYGLFQCREDLNLQVCSECIEAAAVKIVEDCPFYKTALIWYTECMLMYTNLVATFPSPETTTFDFPDAREWSGDFYPTEFGNIVVTTLKHVIRDAVKNTSLGHFASREAILAPSTKKVYCLAQCIPDIDTMVCNRCLKNAFEFMRFGNGIGREINFNLGCQLMYEYDTFISHNLTFLSPTPPPKTSDRPNSPQYQSGGIDMFLLKKIISFTTLILILICSYNNCNAGKGLGAPYIGAIAASLAVGSILFLLTAWICLRRRKLKRRNEDTFEEASNETPTASQFSLV